MCIRDRKIAFGIESIKSVYTVYLVLGEMLMSILFTFSPNFTTHWVLSNLSKVISVTLLGTTVLLVFLTRAKRAPFSNKISGGLVSSVLMLILGWIKSVSYTHLDVYKRQILVSCKEPSEAT